MYLKCLDSWKETQGLFKVKCILISRSFALQKETQTNCHMYRHHVFHNDSKYRMTFNLFESPFGVWNFVKLKCIQPWTDPVFPFNCSNTFHSFDTQFPRNHHKQEDILINCCDSSNDSLRNDFFDVTRQLRQS